MKSNHLLLGALACLAICSCAKQPVIDNQEGFVLIHQPEGPTLGYAPTSGIGILEEGNLRFKDLNRNGLLDKYEDWRLSWEERATDLASQLSLEEIAGLMLYSSHQALPTDTLTNSQLQFLRDDNLRHVLITSVASPAVAARWNNKAQAFVEGLGHGIPNNNSSDPRNSVGGGKDEFTAGAGGEISLWPCELGMGATFDPQLMLEYGEIASCEYRALGFATCLSPQADIATDPRWMRFFGTYGEDPQLTADLVAAYIEGFQVTRGKNGADGWGSQSVNAMVKHWPGGGPGEAGRDAHYGRGKFAVYPGNNIGLQKKPFIEGAFSAQENVGIASAVMPYYTVSLGQSDEAVANNFNADIINRQLRTDAGFKGVVCTDWGVTADEVHPGVHSGKPYGIEHLTVAQRHLKALRAGVDQFGGNNDKQPVLEAFDMMIAEDGEEIAITRIRTSAVRLLINIFHTGLFENPYLIPEESAQVVGNPAFMARGYEAQLKSIVMLKNHNQILPLKMAKQQTSVYIPAKITPAHLSFWGSVVPADTVQEVVSQELCSRYFAKKAENADEAQVALVFIDSPMSGWGHNLQEAYKSLAPGTEEHFNHTLAELLRSYGMNIEAGHEAEAARQYVAQTASINNFFTPAGSKVSAPGNGYYPISLQYEDYVAVDAREESLGQGDPYEAIANRSYKGKGVRTYNANCLTEIRSLRKAHPELPIIVAINSNNPTVLSEIEPLADAILVTFQVQKQAVLDIITGAIEPSGLLPFQMPANMRTVELQGEDTPRDMECYTDADGHVYDFAYGLNWQGVIGDERVKRYK